MLPNFLSTVFSRNYQKQHRFIRYSFEKDPTDNAAKQRESQDCSQKVD